MTESRTLCLLLGVAILVCLAVIEVRAQEGNTATLARVYDAEQTWRRAAILVPGPAWGPPVRQAVPEPRQPRLDPVQKVVDEAEGCAIVWHSRRKHRRTKIECW